MKKWYFFIILPFILLFFISGYSSKYVDLYDTHLSCEWKTSCAGDENDILHISSLTNAHFELPTQTNYPHKLCCKKPLSVNINPKLCDGEFISLSAQTNAHAGKYGDYNYKLCLNDTSRYGFYTCELKNSCGLGQVCLLSLSSTTNAHGGDCNAHSIKVCCNYTPYIELDVFPGNRIETSPGEIVEVYLYVKNNYKFSDNEVIIDFKVIHNSSNTFKDVTDQWKNIYLVDFCEFDTNTNTCIQDVLEKTIIFTPNENKTILFKVLIPREAKLKDEFNVTFNVTSKTLGNSYETFVNYALGGGEVEIEINAYAMDSQGNKLPNIDVNIYICKENVEWCDEGAAIYKYTTNTDENGEINITINPVLILGKKYKLSLVTEKGYSETIIDLT